MSEDPLTTEAGRQIVAAGKQLYAGGYADGAREEREAVVRWLRASIDGWRGDGHVLGGVAEYVDLFAREIAAGEHRRP